MLCLLPNIMKITSKLINPTRPHIYTNPLTKTLPKKCFVTNNDVVLKNAKLNLTDKNDNLDVYLKAGPTEKIAYEPCKTNVAIVNAGGLCPGINNVIYDLVYSLENLYEVKNIYGIRNGYTGVCKYNMMDLNTNSIEGIQHTSGSVLGTSRGVIDPTKVVDYLETRDISQLYVIGGDGTHKGAFEFAKHTDVAIACLPKTIDNDLPIIDKSFGFETAVEKAKDFIMSAYSEIISTENCVGIVKLMGRNCGWIALYAALSSNNVDVCLLPEYPTDENKLFEYVRKLVETKGHCMIVVAEGVRMNDCGDVGIYLKDHLSECYHVKYIDPTYLVRAVPANTTDSIYCKLLAQSAVHACMSGYSGFTVGHVNNKMSIIPLEEIVNNTNFVSEKDSMWIRLLLSNLQPDLSI